MRGKIALIGAMAVLLSSTSVNAAGKKAPQDSAGQGTEQPQGNAPAPAQPKVKRSNALLPAAGALLAAGLGGAAGAGALDDEPNSP